MPESSAANSTMSGSLRGNRSGMVSWRTVLDLEDGSRTKIVEWTWPRRCLALAFLGLYPSHSQTITGE